MAEKMPPNRPDNLLLGVHEERIQHLEEGQAGMRSDVSNLTQRVDAGFDLIASKLDGFRHDLRNHASEDKEVAGRVFAVTQQVRDIVQSNKTRIDRREAFWKYAWPFIMAFVGAFAKALFDHFTKK